MEIGKRLTPPTTTGSSFDEETRELLEARCKLAYGIAFVLSIVAWLFYQYVLDVEELIVDTPLAPWHELAYLFYPIAFGLALVWMVVRNLTVGRLLVLDHAVMVFTLLLSVATQAVYLPTQAPLMAVGLILFVHAAIIPVRTSYQVGLAVWATLGFPAAMLLSNAFVPGIQEAWASAEPGAFTAVTLEGTFAIAMFGIVSALITQALYGLRRSLHDAKRMGSYIIDKEIGAGGMGQIYVAEHALLCRPTAIKTVRADSKEHAVNIARFEREVRLSSTLTHPNTITIYDFGRTADDAFYYAMEYLEGLDLQAMVERFGPLSPPRTVYILSQVCGSLIEAHARDIVHRDIKPSNVFLTHRGGMFDFVKVLDFGLAKQIEAEGSSAITKTGVLFGTPRYLAPETVYGTDRVDARADIYNLGGVAYWMLTGRPPFASESSVEVIIDHVKTAPIPPSQISELEIPEALDRIVMKCLEKRPENRYQNACQIEDALSAIHFDDPWTAAKAREWWSLHAPEVAGAETCRVES